MIIVIAVVVIIALRDVLLDAIAHEVITTYNPFKIGDWIQVGKFFGRVVDITWTNTVLMTPNSEMVYIPNSTLTKNIVVNRTTQSGVRISVSLRMEKSLDFSEVEKSLLEIGEELGEELATDSKPEVRLIDLENSSMKVALLLRINNPAKGKILASEVRKRMKMKLEELQRRPK
jgi:small conductance mechanosensitive channel